MEYNVCIFVGCPVEGLVGLVFHWIFLSAFGLEKQKGVAERFGKGNHERKGQKNLNQASIDQLNGMNKQKGSEECRFYNACHVLPSCLLF